MLEAAWVGVCSNNSPPERIADMQAVQYYHLQVWDSVSILLVWGSFPQPRVCIGTMSAPEGRGSMVYDTVEKNKYLTHSLPFDNQLISHEQVFLS